MLERYILWYILGIFRCPVAFEALGQGLYITRLQKSQDEEKIPGKCSGQTSLNCGQRLVAVLFFSTLLIMLINGKRLLGGGWG